jgi:L-asparagine transporter-like permease
MTPLTHMYFRYVLLYCPTTRCMAVPTSLCVFLNLIIYQRKFGLVLNVCVLLYCCGFMDCLLCDLFVHG